MENKLGSASASRESSRPASRPRRGTLQSGYSLLSRGEPRIWFTGGLLVICLFMIGGLLALILMNGLATFWPRPVDWLLLSNGTMNVGEPQLSVASDKDKSASPRRYYRTGNFELTQEHYRWFEPEELSPGGQIALQDLLVIERLSNGRMYALPAQLKIDLAVQKSSQTDDWNSFQHFEKTWNEVSGELGQLQTTPPPDANVVTQFSESVVKKAIDAKSASLRASIDGLDASDKSHLWLQYDGSAEWQQLSADNQKKLIAGAKLVWNDADAIVDRFNDLSPQIHSRHSEAKRLTHDISRLDRLLSDARVAVRQAELDTGAKVLERIDEIGPMVEELLALEQKRQRIEDAIKSATNLFPGDQAGKEVVRLLNAYSSQSLGEQTKSVESRIAAWKAQFDQEQEPIKRAIAKFESTWRDVLTKKRPMEQGLEQIRQQAGGAELMLALPNNATKLELPADAVKQLNANQISDELKQSLESIGLVVDGAVVASEKFDSGIQSFSVVTQDKGTQHIWVYPATASAAPDANGAQPNLALVTTSHGLSCDEIVRIVPANRLSVFGKLGVYMARWREFLFDDPREANSEGGVFPAIWGTIVMTLIMTLAVVPFGVIAALYLREYTRSGPLVSLVRISINNLAGVPSIVYGVFGLAFFCYTIGAFVDGGAKNADIAPLPPPMWYLLLAVTAIVGFAAFVMSFLSSGPAHLRTPTAKLLAKIAPWLWLISVVAMAAIILKSPFFHGFYQARLPQPTFGKEGLLWASFTLALLTLPVVIVATEEALAAVPNSLREGSLACGASKWQTIYRIVLPHARPGILTGAILAMARGIGEVAPLMLVGALPVAPDLPLDTEFPFFHGSRSFMHLGYQIYWLGFQSQNSEASKPMVFTCTLLLILIVAALNLSAILLRARLRRRFQGNQF